MNFLLVIGEKLARLKTAENDKSNEKDIAEIQLPHDLENEIFLPLKMDVCENNGSKIGEIQSWIPRERQIGLCVEQTFSEIVMDNSFQAGVLKTRNLINGSEESFEIEKVDMKSADPEIQKWLKENGFHKGYTVKRNAMQLNVHLFDKKGQRRVLLENVEPDDWKKFLPILIVDEFWWRLSSKKVKEEITIPVPVSETRKVYVPLRADPVGDSAEAVVAVLPVPILEENGKNDGGKNSAKSFKDFCLSFPVTYREKAVNYVDSNGEWGMFCELMDCGFPVLLNGPTGCGKDALIRCYAYDRKLPYFRKEGHRDITTRDLLEGFWNSGGIRTPGPLALAWVHGGIFYLEEIGPVNPDVLTGLHGALDEGSIEIHSHFGYERLEKHPDARIVFSGNLDRNYTLNELSQAFLGRLPQIKMGYPNPEKTADIIIANSGASEKIAKQLTEITFELRSLLADAGRDFGLRGPIRVAQQFVKGTRQNLMRLIEAHMIEPSVTYDESGLEENLKKAVAKKLGVGFSGAFSNKTSAGIPGTAHSKVWEE